MEKIQFADNYFVIIPRWILFADISAQAVRLYGVLRKYADNETLEAWPSKNTLSSDLRVDSTKTIERAIKELIEIGALQVIKRRNDDGKIVGNLYRLVSNQPSHETFMSKNTDKFVPVLGQELPPNYNHITKPNKGNKPDGLQVKNLMAIYFENYTGELEPSRGQIAGQLQTALKQIPYEKLEPLVIRVALDGQTISRNTLIFAQNKIKPVTPTRIPDKFDPAEFEKPDAVPMPDSFRNALRSIIKKPSEGATGDV